MLWLQPSAWTLVSPLVAIVNARIHPITAATIERGVVVIKNGRIESLGASVAVPPGAQVVDAAGADVYPGFIDASTTLGLDEPGPRGFADTAESVEFSPHLRTRTAYHPDSDAIAVARSNGITTVGVAPTSGLLAGELAVMNLDGWTWEEATLSPSAGIASQFPPLVRARSFGGGGNRAEQSYADLKKERDRKLDALADLLGRARAYARMVPSARPTDWLLASLVPVVERDLPLVVTANREADIRDAVQFAEREHLRLVIEGGAEAPLVSSLLRDKKVPVIFGPVLQLPTRADGHQAATYKAAAALAEAGVTFSLSGGNDATNVRLLPYQAAQSVAWGLPRDKALSAITIDAATILGVDREVGSLRAWQARQSVHLEGRPPRGAYRDHPRLHQRRDPSAWTTFTSSSTRSTSNAVEAQACAPRTVQPKT